MFQLVLRSTGEVHEPGPVQSRRDMLIAIVTDLRFALFKLMLQIGDFSKQRGEILGEFASGFEGLEAFGDFDGGADES